MAFPTKAKITALVCKGRKRPKLNNEIPLIGFAGSPWTILCYCVQGQGSKTFDKAKELLGLNENPENNFLAKLVKSQERALEAQVKNLDRQIALQQKLGKDTTELEIKKEQIQLDFARKRLRLVEENLTKEQAARLGLNDSIFEAQQEILDRENQIAILRIKNEKQFTQEISDEFRKRAATFLTIERDKN